MRSTVLVMLQTHNSFRRCRHEGASEHRTEPVDTQLLQESKQDALTDQACSTCQQAEVRRQTGDLAPQSQGCSPPVHASTCRAAVECINRPSAHAEDELVARHLLMGKADISSPMVKATKSVRDPPAADHTEQHSLTARTPRSTSCPHHNSPRTQHQNETVHNQGRISAGNK